LVSEVLVDKVTLHQARLHGWDIFPPRTAAEFPAHCVMH